MSQKVKIVSAKVRGEVYLGVCYHPVNGMPGDSWSHDGDVVTNWLADGYRARFNQHRSKRSKYLSIAGEIFEDKGGERVLVPLGDSVDDYTDAEARRMLYHAHGRTPSEPQPDIMVVGGSDVAARMSPVPVVGTGETRRLGSEKKRSA